MTDGVGGLIAKYRREARQAAAREADTDARLRAARQELDMLRRSLDRLALSRRFCGHGVVTEDFTDAACELGDLLLRKGYGQP